MSPLSTFTVNSNTDSRTYISKQCVLAEDLWLNFALWEAMGTDNASFSGY
jgi:hypothetical protein